MQNETLTSKATQEHDGPEANWGMIVKIINALRPKVMPDVSGDPDWLNEHEVYWDAGNGVTVEMAMDPEDVDGPEYLFSWCKDGRSWIIQPDGRKTYYREPVGSGDQMGKPTMWLPMWP
jgi:hypothetical protein